jgi:hypothetical protein
MNARKATCNHGDTPEESRFKRGMLAAGAFAVVPIADDAPSDTRVPVLLRDLGYSVDDIREGVECVTADRVAAVEGLCAGEEVVRDVPEVAAVFVPGAGGGDVVGCAFACERGCQCAS